MLTFAAVKRNRHSRPHDPPGVGPGDAGAAADVRRILRGGGQPLEAGTRRFMEARLGASFEDVRVFDDDESHAAARQLNARAFTVAGRIHFNSGEYTPETAGGRLLLAHELCHVLQQAGKPVRIQRRWSREEEKKPAPPPPPKKEPKKEQKEWEWWGAECRPAPPGVSVTKLVEKVLQVVKAGRTLGYNLAADNLENYLLAKKASVKLPTKTLSENKFVLDHLGPDSNLYPSESLIRRGIAKGVNFPGEHHVVFLSGVLRRLEDGTNKIGDRISLHYEDSISFYTEARDQYPDLAYGIAGCTIYSDVTVETAMDDGQVTVHYLSWSSWISDQYNFDKGKIAVFSVGNFCIPDSDLVRIKEAGYAKDYPMSTDRWKHPSRSLTLLWFPIPYRPPQKP